MKNIKLLQSCIVCLLVGVLLSCQQDVVEDSIQEGGALTVSLSVPFQDDKGYITYAMPADESKIEHLAVLVFKTDPVSPTDPSKGTFLYRAGVSYNSPNPADCILKVQEMGDAQTFVFIANARSIVDNTPIAEGETKAAVIQKLLMSQTTAFDALTMSSIPMWGEVHNQVINNGVVPTGLSCKLYRMLAKINVSVNSTILTSDFELRTVHLYMPRQKGTLIPDNWGGYTGTVPGEPTEAVSTPTQPTAAGTVPARATKYTYTTTTNKVENIYSFESKNIATPAVDYLDQACLVVGGWYKNDRTKQYYYRIDLKVGATQLDILRNFVYNVTIQSVGGMGVETPDDAYKGLSVIEATIEPWNVATGNVQVGSSHLYVSNRAPWLKLDGTTHPFPDSKVLKIKTSDPAGWKWKNDPTTTATLTAFNVTTTGGTANTEVTVVWNPSNITTTIPAGRDGKAIIVSGNVEYTLFFIQDDCGRVGIPLPQTIGTNVYKTHRYGAACWMVENSKEGVGSSLGYGLNWAGASIGDLINGNPSYRGLVNGYYYTWAQAMVAAPNVAAPCPTGWILPNVNQWNALKTPVNGDLSNTGKWWSGYLGTANNAYAGLTIDGGVKWGWWGTIGCWWSSSATRQRFDGNTSWMYGPNVSATASCISVRCVQN